MIIVKLQGGLGNQLFQYSFGRSVSIRMDTPLFFDITAFSQPDRNGVRREFLLDKFDVVGQIASPSDYKKISNFYTLENSLFQKAVRKLFRVWELVVPLSMRKVFVEYKYTYISEVFKTSKDCLFIGVWQSYKYFKNIENILFDELKLRVPLSNMTQKWTVKIETTDSVSIHIRRGDYVQIKNTNLKHGTCSVEYYEQAILYVASKVSNPHFFIFSDDIEWAKKHIHPPFSFDFVSDISLPNYEELVMMSKCDHNIIANSSFSWWGAWLNLNPHKIVIAPKKWFALEEMDDSDVVPPEWIRI